MGAAVRPVASAARHRRGALAADSRSSFPLPHPQRWPAAAGGWPQAGGGQGEGGGPEHLHMAGDLLLGTVGWK